MAAASPQSKQENQLVSLAFNIIVPSIILSKASGEEYLGPFYGFIVALAFPLGYGIWDFISRKKFNFIAALGLVNILLTGGLGLAKVEGIYFAIKEAAVPSIIGLAVLISSRTKKPLVKALLFNPSMMDVEKVEAALEKNQATEKFDALLKQTTLLLALSFLLSAILNFGLAAYLLKSPSGTEAFNVELGKMTALSYPVIVLPCMVVTGFALWKLIKGIKSLTGLDLEEILHGKHEPKKEANS